VFFRVNALFQISFRSRAIYFLPLPPLLPAVDLPFSPPDEDVEPFAAPPDVFDAPPDFVDFPALPPAFVPEPPPAFDEAAVLPPLEAPPLDFAEAAVTPALPVPFVPASAPILFAPPSVDEPALLVFEAAPLPPLEPAPLDFEAAPVAPFDVTPALPVPFVPESAPRLFAPPLPDELALLLFDEAVFPAPTEPPCPLVFEEEAAVFADFPALPVPFVPASAPSSKSLTASATTPKTPTAAPVAAPARSSPAASLAWSRSPGSELFLEDFFAPLLLLFDFVEPDF
jgi:hypothetical protein